MNPEQFDYMHGPRLALVRQMKLGINMGQLCTMTDACLGPNLPQWTKEHYPCLALEPWPNDTPYHGPMLSQAICAAWGAIGHTCQYNNNTEQQGL